MYGRQLTSGNESHGRGGPGMASQQQQLGSQNPFLDQNEFHDVSRNDSEMSLLRDEHGGKVDAQGGGAISDYRGYYSRQNPQQGDNVAAGPAGGVVGGIDPTGAGLDVPGQRLSERVIPNSDIMSPPAFDRYPTVGGSRVSSGAPTPNQQQLLSNQEGGAGAGGAPKQWGLSGSEENSMSSLTSSNPFLGDQDFSPFGGYPASSFPLLLEEKEEDDYLHNPDPEEEARLDKQRFMLDLKHMDKRSAGGLFGLLFLFLGSLILFIVLPVLTYTGAVERSKPIVHEILTQYRYPQLSAIRTSLIDPDTPHSAYHWKSLHGDQWDLVFSDEFNAVGRTFYEGDDQFWTGPEIHYDATKDLEWYSADASSTHDGILELRMDAFKTHGLYYRSGMVQSWNKMCYTQGALEISVNLPNYGHVAGLWPGLWTMGNLGRPGYMASTEGVWPYSYSECDAGITPNQSSTDGISFLPGQRLAACVCDGEDHPSPGIGRGAPEIDLIEGSVDTTLGVGTVSQSAQIAPYDIWYIPDYEFIEIYNKSTTTMNTYCGGPFQQAISAVTTLNNAWYQYGPESGYFQKFTLEYLNDDKDGYIRWIIGDTPVYTIYANALHPNGNIGWRQISKEPMSIIMNLGISNNWAYIDWPMIFFPVKFSIDYVRIYQPPNAVSVTCDPPDYPTYDYIQNHLSAYSNFNLTTWASAGYSFPKNVLTGKCYSSKYDSKGNRKV